MDWQIITIALSNVALICWFRAESRNDWRQSDLRINAHIEKMNNLYREMDERFFKETKDFHGRMIALEERRKNEKN